MDIIKIPFYTKAAFIFIAFYAFIYTLYIGQHIIVPILYATIIAILLNPFVNFLTNKKVSKVLAITIAVMLAFAITVGFIYFISSQFSMFADAYPQLKIKVDKTGTQSIFWISKHFNISVEKINLQIQHIKDRALNDSGLLVGQTLLNLSSMLVILLLMPVYISMLLYYKPLMLEFLRRVFTSTHQAIVSDVLDRTKFIIQGYLKGLLIEAVVVATLNSVALLILGIDYAIVLGITGALINVIPFIGGVISIALPMIIAFVTKDSLSYPLLVLIIYLTIQFIDNHFIIPRIVASKVKINALISVIAVLVGGAIWGLPGMFLSIPLTAILKVIFDSIEMLKPWGYLLGNIVPTATKFSFIKPKKASLPVK